MSDLLPHDLETEAALVGWCLMLPVEAWRVLDHLTPDDFYRPAWAACIAELRKGHRTQAELADLTGVDVVELMGAVSAAPYRHDIDRLVGRVADLAARRRVILASSEAIDAARDLTVDLATPADSLRGLLDDLDAPPVNRVTEADEFLVESDDTYDWVVPGLLERGDRMLVTAGEGVGKSHLLRFMALAIAAGVHPFRRTTITPRRVLLVDVENQPRKVRREIRPWLHLVEGWNPGMLAIEVRVGGINLDHSADRRWLAGKMAAHRPDLLVIGPLYQLHGAAPKGDIGGENHARELARTLDRLRERFGCALLMETHAPHGSMGSRDLRPFGSSVWLRWPEFGIGLRVDRDRGEHVFRVVHWRGPRDRRDFPTYLEKGRDGGWPWVATYPGKEEQW